MPAIEKVERDRPVLFSSIIETSPRGPNVVSEPELALFDVLGLLDGSARSIRGERNESTDPDKCSTCGVVVVFDGAQHIPTAKQVGEGVVDLHPDQSIDIHGPDRNWCNPIERGASPDSLVTSHLPIARVALLGERGSFPPGPRRDPAEASPQNFVDSGAERSTQ